jgi:hypothetical protein
MRRVLTLRWACVQYLLLVEAALAMRVTLAMLELTPARVAVVALVGVLETLEAGVPQVA